MLRLFLALSVEVNLGSWLDINLPFLHSFFWGLWFGCIAYWLLEELQLDPQYEIKGSPHVIDELYYIGSDSWNNLPTYNTWKYFATNWISAVICFILVVASYLLGFASLFFCEPVLSLLFLVTTILESLSAELSISMILIQHIPYTPPMAMPVGG